MLDMFCINSFYLSLFCSLLNVLSNHSLELTHQLTKIYLIFQEEKITEKM